MNGGAISSRRIGTDADTLRVHFAGGDPARSAAQLAALEAPGIDGGTFYPCDGFWRDGFELYSEPAYVLELIGAGPAGWSLAQGIARAIFAATGERAILASYGGETREYRRPEHD